MDDGSRVLSSGPSKPPAIRAPHQGCPQALREVWVQTAPGSVQVHGDRPARHLQEASRESIVKTAIARASVFYRCQQFERIVSVGDAVWDLQTAKQLGLPFIGVGNQERGTIL